MTTDSTAFPAPYPWLRLALVVVAALELLDALTRAHNIFTDYHYPTALLRFAQALTSVQLALAPFITAAAFIQALRLRGAILALAALAFTIWLFDLPSILIRGFDFTPDYGGAVVFAHRVIIPAVVLAGLLVSMPNIVKWVAVAVFMVAITI